MEWRFGDYILNSERAELTGSDGLVHVEKLPLDLLLLLAINADRVVSRDEIIEAVWGGRFVSEAVISTAIKQVRKAVGDSGARQAVIRTVHGRGFRFVAPLRTPVNDVPTAATSSDQIDPTPIGTDQASVAVLRFELLGKDQARPELTDGLPAELISSLSKLRWLHVTARGSSFRFDPARPDPEQVARELGVRYLLTGRIEPINDMLTISVELLSASNGALVWSERYATAVADIQMARQDIVASIISAFEIQVPQFESEHARRLSPTQLDAWSHYHLGLRHMYRYNEADNAIAAGHFRSAIELDREFSRAHSGLSFTYWQNAFMNFGEDRKLPLEKAVAAASRALEIDGQDPFASFNMGRARWLEGDVDAGIDWLDRALLVNPNYAQCHYTRGLSKVLTGRPDDALGAADKAMQLSPLDPLLYAMLSTKAIAHIANEDFAAASVWAEKAVRVPGAHFYISMVTAIALELGGDRASAERWRDEALARRPEITASMFFQAFPFKDAALKTTLTNALARLGFKQ